MCWRLGHDRLCPARRGGSPSGSVLDKELAADMTTPFAPPSAPVAPAGRPQVAPKLARRRRVDPLSVALPLGLAAVLAVGAVVLLSKEVAKTAVLEATTQVAAGARLSPADFRVVAVSASDHLPAVAAQYRGELSDYWAATTIYPGSVLTSSMVSSTGGAPSGEQLVGLVLSSKQAPPDLFVGERVDVVVVTAPSAPTIASGSKRAGPAFNGQGALPAQPLDSYQPGQVLTQAVVWGTPSQQASSSSSVLSTSSATSSTSSAKGQITLAVPKSIASTVAALGAQSELAVTVLPAASSNPLSVLPSTSSAGTTGGQLGVKTSRAHS